MKPAAAPTRLAFCITELDPGGAERALVQIVTRLDRAEWDPFVVCLAGEGAMVAALEAADVPVTCLGAGHNWQLAVVLKLVRELRRRQPALLQTFLFHANIAGRIAGKLAGVPRIVSGIRVAEKRSKLPLWIDRWTERLVDRHVCVSQAVADFSIQQAGLAPARVTVIGNGVDAARFASAAPADLSQFGIPARSRTVLWVGRLDPQKQPAAVIETAELLSRASHLLVQFLVAGEGPLRGALEQQVHDKRLENCVHFAGWRDDVASLMKSAGCLLLTSAWEGMPNVVLEAMAAGLPVVATNVEGVGQVVTDGENGLLLASDRATDIAAGIERLLNDPALCNRLAQTAQTTVSQRFTWDAVAAEYAALYRALLRL